GRVEILEAPGGDKVSFRKVKDFWVLSDRLGQVVCHWPRPVRSQDRISTQVRTRGPFWQDATPPNGFRAKWIFFRIVTSCQNGIGGSNVWESTSSHPTGLGQWHTTYAPNTFFASTLRNIYRPANSLASMIWPAVACVASQESTVASGISSTLIFSS